MSRRRTLSPFNLSFLDIMFCGFGAVTLLVLIVNSHSVAERRRQNAALRQQLAAAGTASRAAHRLLTQRRQRLRALQDAITQARTSATGLEGELVQLRSEIEQAQQGEEAEQERLAALREELARLESRERQMAAVAGKRRGNSQRAFQGQGRRQYLTGLRLEGRRTVILVDASASMLDRTIVDIIRTRILPPERRRLARKWTQARRTAKWLLANLPAGAKVCLIAFNTTPRLLGPKGRAWLPIADKEAVDRAVSALDDLAPEGGTSLENAFARAAALSPPPDNLILLTDGLPTQGSHPGTGVVTPEERVKFFEQATADLPPGVPVNTILFPMEGDPAAPALFWQLAVATRGAFLTPSEDWP